MSEASRSEAIGRELGPAAEGKAKFWMRTLLCNLKTIAMDEDDAIGGCEAEF